MCSEKIVVSGPIALRGKLIEWQIDRTNWSNA